MAILTVPLTILELSRGTGCILACWSSIHLILTSGAFILILARTTLRQARKTHRIRRKVSTWTILHTFVSIEGIASHAFKTIDGRQRAFTTVRSTLHANVFDLHMTQRTISLTFIVDHDEGR